MMEAVAYQALVEGTCEAVCNEGAPQPCPYGEHSMKPCQVDTEKL